MENIQTVDAHFAFCADLSLSKGLNALTIVWSNPRLPKIAGPIGGCVAANFFLSKTITHATKRIKTVQIIAVNKKLLHIVSVKII